MGVPLLLGAVFMTIGLVIWRRARSLRQEGVRTSGTVVRLHTHRDFDSNRTMYSPVVQWVAADGQTVEVTSSISSGSVSDDLRPGSAVTVFYHPDNPKRMLIDGHGSGLFVVVFCLIGAACLAASLIVLGVLVT
ncbi:MAG: DUF3592 domain-containing protein [Actinocatenispora sp.]